MIKKIFLLIIFSLFLNILIFGQSTFAQIQQPTLDYENKTTSPFKEDKENLIQLKIQQKENLREKINSFKNDFKILKEINKNIFQGNLEKIKDEGKKQIALKIEENLNKLNEKMVNKYIENYEKLENFLNFLKEKTNENNYNNPQFKEKLTELENKLNNLKEKILNQSAKLYNTRINDEKNLKFDLDTTKNQLKEDLKNIEKEIINLKNDLINFFKTLKGQNNS